MPKKSKRKFSPFYTNNVRKSFDHTMNRIYDMLEKKTYLDQKIQFEAVILTGAATGGSTSGGFFDKVREKIFGKESLGFKIRFHGADEDSNFILDPFAPGISDTEKINRISMHPFAYIKNTGTIDSSLNYGDVVLVEKIGDSVYVIKKNISRGDIPPRRRGRTRSIPRSGYSRVDPVDLDFETELHPIITSLNESDYVFLFGDSQMEGSLGLGSILENEFSNTNRVGKSSKKPSYFLDNFNTTIKRYLDRKPKVIIIALGGNIVSTDSDLKKESDSAIELLKKIKAVTGESKIIWIGPPPPSRDGTKYNLDGTQVRKRKKKNNVLETNVGPSVDYFINSFELPGYSNGYTCNRRCDGIHIVGNQAKRFLKLAGLVK